MTKKPNNRLKEARKIIGITQESFGKPFDLNQANIRDLESGKVKISTLHAIALEKIYRISSSWLLNGQCSMFTDGTAPDTKPETESVKERMMSMLNRLDADDLRSVCSVIEEKLRVRELERKVEELAAVQRKFVSDSDGSGAFIDNP